MSVFGGGGGVVSWEGLIHTVITPVAALTPASPNIAVAASVTNAVAPILTTLIA